MQKKWTKKGIFCPNKKKDYSKCHRFKKSTINSFNLQFFFLINLNGLESIFSKSFFFTKNILLNNTIFLFNRNDFESSIRNKMKCLRLVKFLFSFIDHIVKHHYNIKNWNCRCSQIFIKKKELNPENKMI